MSSFACKATTITAIVPHENADKLELAQIGGWTAVVGKDIHKAGDTIVYIPTDAVLPLDLCERFGYGGLLSGSNKNRVKAVRLRGVLSEGLVIPASKVEAEIGTPVELGVDYAEALGIVKYEVPIPVHMAGEVASAPDWFRIHYDIENIKNWPDVLGENEPVCITEKLHGTNCRVGLDREGNFLVGSRNKDRSLVESETNLYWRAVTNEDIREKLQRLMDSLQPITSTIVLFGEVTGQGVQDLVYDGDIRFRAFDMMMDGEYIPPQALEYFCMKYGITTVPVKFVGVATLEDIMRFSTTSSTIANHVQEGVVVKPVVPRRHDDLGRVILKCINPDYLTRKGGTEYH